MLAEYDRHIESLEDSNLSSLFLQYVHLPLNNAYEVRMKNNTKKYKNYDSLGHSPRMNK